MREKMKRAEKRIESIISISLLILPFQVGSFIYDLRTWGIFKSASSQTLTYLGWFSAILGSALFYWIFMGLINFYNTISYRIDLQEEVNKFRKDNALTIGYEELNNNTKFYKGKYVKYHGTILQKLESDFYTQIRLDIGTFVPKVIAVQFNGFTHFDINDIVTIYGKVHGQVDFETISGDKVSLPGILADEISYKENKMRSRNN